MNTTRRNRDKLKARALNVFILTVVFTILSIGIRVMLSIDKILIQAEIIAKAATDGIDRITAQDENKTTEGNDMFEE